MIPGTESGVELADQLSAERTPGNGMSRPTARRTWSWHLCVPAKVSSAMLYTRVIPKRSPSHAVHGTTTPSANAYAVTTHCAS
ncbi:MAG: hypothetical protein ACRDTX_19000, partial [Pseudonocardiaceae bacterium]